MDHPWDDRYWIRRYKTVADGFINNMDIYQFEYAGFNGTNGFNETVSNGP